MSSTTYSNLMYAGGTRANNSRALNTSFQPNASRDTLVIFIIRTTGGNAEGRVDMYTDSANPPTTLWLDTDSGANVTGLLATGNFQSDQLICDIIKAGDYVKLTTVTVSGSPVFSIVHQKEITL